MATNNIIKPCPLCETQMRITVERHKGVAYFTIGCRTPKCILGCPTFGLPFNQAVDFIERWNWRNGKPGTQKRSSIEGFLKIVEDPKVAAEAELEINRRLDEILCGLR